MQNPESNFTIPTESTRTIGSTNIIPVRQYIVLGICIIGMPANLIVVKIMTAPPFNKMPHSIICTALALADFGYLLYLTSYVIMVIVLGGYQAMLTLCKFQYAGSYFGFHLDAWFLVFLTYERLIGVVWPLKAADMITKRKTKIIIVFLVGFFLMWDGFYVIRWDTFTLKVGNISFKNCGKVNDFGIPKSVLNINDHLTDLLAVFIPMLFIVVGNTVIIVTLYKRKAIRTQLGQNSGNDMTKTNLMILMVTSAFVCLMTPGAIYTMFIYEGVGTDSFKDPIKITFYYLSALNPAINCCIYFLTGKLFREQLKNMFNTCGCCREQRMDRSTAAASRTSLSVLANNT